MPKCTGIIVLEVLSQRDLHSLVHASLHSAVFDMATPLDLRAHRWLWLADTLAAPQLARRRGPASCRLAASTRRLAARPAIAAMLGRLAADMPHILARPWRFPGATLPHLQPPRRHHPLRRLIGSSLAPRRPRRLPADFVASPPASLPRFFGAALPPRIAALR